MLKIYNTISKQKETFEPIDKKNVRMYVCGPTVYADPHLGNALSVVLYDILFRILLKIYGKESVTYVRNITDFDDKINAESIKRKISPEDLTTQIIKRFNEDLKELNCLSPSIEPKASQEIKTMVQMIKKLIESGHAYLSGENIYFKVESFNEYGEISGRKLADLESGNRVALQEDKKSPHDFLLWKKEDKNAPVSFKTEFGIGRPGWHIECSAMATKYLGKDFDIHGGGVDLIFPHHSNEIAQSKCANKDSIYAKYWVHNGFLTVSGSKMSKSLGNFVTLNDALRSSKLPDAIRYVLITSHYRKPSDYSEKHLDDARKLLCKFYVLLKQEKVLEENTDEYLENEFLNYLFDDINTPKAISYLHKKYGDITRTTDALKRRSCSLKLLASLRFLGFFSNLEVYEKLQNTEKNEVLSREFKNFIEEKIIERSIAKKNKNFDLADSIRDVLKNKGIELIDTKDGTKWKVIN